MFLYKSIISPFMPELKDKKFDGQIPVEMDILEKIVIDKIRYTHSMY